MQGWMQQGSGKPWGLSTSHPKTVGLPRTGASEN